MLSRRSFLQISAAGTAALSAGGFTSAADASLNPAPFSAKLGWKIGPQIYSFNKFPFDEAVKKVQACNVNSFELYSGQKLSKDINVAVGPALLKPENKDALKRFKDLLAETGTHIHAIGVCPADRAHFDFAAAFGLSVLNAEPGFDKIAEVSKLADEYKIRVGLHNHPKPSIYWNPDIVLEHLKDASSRVGACCDTGHWLRSGLCPIESLKKLKGKVVSFHIKDLKKTGEGKYDADCPLGQGEVGIAALLKEAAAQKIHAPFSIEFEAAWNNNVPQVAESVQYFESIAKELSSSGESAAKVRLKNFRSRLRKVLG
ncbi:MAG: TIM barrel protein [Planctomycetaceae bacterium]|jgi:sugar phosphate isomerase/epimerase|nr:TIM barrel protein [Planctomycetaceae bacterium]